MKSHIKLFGALVFVLGLGLAALFIAQVGRAIVESGIRGVCGKRKIKDRVAKLSKHYVICGYGRIGSAICLKLREMYRAFSALLDKKNSAPGDHEKAWKKPARRWGGQAAIF